MAFFERVLEVVTEVDPPAGREHLRAFVMEPDVAYPAALDYIAGIAGVYHGALEINADPSEAARLAKDGLVRGEHFLVDWIAKLPPIAWDHGLTPLQDFDRKDKALVAREHALEVSLTLIQRALRQAIGGQGFHLTISRDLRYKLRF